MRQTTELLHTISFWTVWSVSCVTIWRNWSNGYMTNKLHWHTGMLQRMVAEIGLHQSQSFLLFSRNCWGLEPSYYREFLMTLTMLSFKERGEKPGAVKGFCYIKTMIGVLWYSPPGETSECWFIASRYTWMQHSEPHQSCTSICLLSLVITVDVWYPFYCSYDQLHSWWLQTSIPNDKAFCQKNNSAAMGTWICGGGPRTGTHNCLRNRNTTDSSWRLLLSL